MRRHTGDFSDHTLANEAGVGDQVSNHGQEGWRTEIRSQRGSNAGEVQPPSDGIRIGVPGSAPSGSAEQRLTAWRIIRMIVGFIVGIVLVAFIWQTLTTPTAPSQSLVDSHPSAKHCVTLRGPGKGNSQNLIEREAGELATTLRHREEYLHLLKKQNQELGILLLHKNETLQQLRAQQLPIDDQEITPTTPLSSQVSGEASPPSRVATAAAAAVSGAADALEATHPSPAPLINASSPVEAPVALSENLVTNQSRRSLLWQCPRLYDFTPEEDALVKSLVKNGALVRNPLTSRPSTAICTSAPVPSTMRALVEGSYIPAKETLDHQIGKAELDIVRNVSDEMCPPPPKGKKPSEVHLCAVVRNRAKLVSQWIQYHRMLGIRTFHIFDDSSTDETLQALHPFVEAGIVELGQLPPPPYQFLGRELPGKQFAAFEICLERGRNKMQSQHPLKVWMAFFDTDEFLLTDKCATDLIKDVEATARARSGNRRPVGAVVVGWSLVPHLPTHWVDKSPTIFDATNFKFGDLNYHFKSISRSDVVVPFSSVPVSPHGFQLNPPYFSYYEDGEPSGNILSSEPEMHYAPGRAVLLHYHTRSLSSKLQRAIDGRAGHVHRPSETRTLQNHVDDWLLRSGGDGSFVDIPLTTTFRRRYLTLLRGLGYSTTDSAMATMLMKKNETQNQSPPPPSNHRPLPLELRAELAPLYERFIARATDQNRTDEGNRSRSVSKVEDWEWEDDVTKALRRVGQGLWENLLRPIPSTPTPQEGGRERTVKEGKPKQNAAKTVNHASSVADTPTTSLLQRLLQEHLAPTLPGVESTAFASATQRLQHTISERFVGRMRQCRRSLQHKSWGQESELEEWREMMRREGNGPYAFGY